MVTEEFLIQNNFTKIHDSIGWAKFVKNNFEITKIPLKNKGFAFGFEYQNKYKYPISIQELKDLYKILTGNIL